MKDVFCTIVVTRSYESFSLVKDCLYSLSLQTVPVTILFLDQHPTSETRKYVESLKSKFAKFHYRVIPAKSLSFARNYGLKNSITKYVAFCDVDCILSNNWIGEILNTFIITHAGIVGTKISPLWKAKTTWFHKSKFIQEFYSLLDISSERCEVAKVIGASFAVDKTVLGYEVYFDEKLGRKNGNYLGGEETDLCSRVITKGGKIVYTPFTTAYHQVDAYRLKATWLFKRAYYGGLSRAYRGGTVKPFNTRYSLIDRISIAFILPFYLLGFLKGIMK